MHTITGIGKGSSASEGLDVQIERLLVALGEDCIQPLSRWLIRVLVVPDVDRRPMARLATVITIGRPRPTALYTASAMNSGPKLAVAVYVRTRRRTRRWPRSSRRTRSRR